MIVSTLLILSITAPSIVMKSNGLSLRGLTLAKGLLAVEPLQVDFELVLRRPIETARHIRTVHKNAPRTKGSAPFSSATFRLEREFLHLSTMGSLEPTAASVIFRCSLDSSGHRASEILADYMFAENL